MAELLHSKGYLLHGMIQSLAGVRATALRQTMPFLNLVEGDLRDLDSLTGAIESTQPDEIYNLGALSSVSQSWAQPQLTAEITGLGALRLLEAIGLNDMVDRVRFYQASSSEMFGRPLAAPQDENTPFNPIHPYAVAKVFAHHSTVNYRNAYGLFAAAGILFNHESPRRGDQFVTRKITRGVARIALGLQDHLSLGNLDARRDWGYAPEYVEAMWLMLQRPEPRDYVIATGVGHSVRDFVETAFRHIGIEDWTRHVRHDPSLLRPVDIVELRGDPSKAHAELGWEPRTSFDELVRMMVAAEREREGAAQNAFGQTGPPG